METSISTEDSVESLPSLAEPSIFCLRLADGAEEVDFLLVTLSVSLGSSVIMTTHGRTFLGMDQLGRVK